MTAVADAVAFNWAGAASDIKNLLYQGVNNGFCNENNEQPRSNDSVLGAATPTPAGSINSTTSQTTKTYQQKMKPADVHLMLARAIQRRKNILFAAPGRGNNVTQQMKEEEWESLRKEMISYGVDRFERKTWQTVRDVDFQQIRRKAIHRQTLAQQGTGCLHESEFDTIMMEILSFNSNGENRFNFDARVNMDTSYSSPQENGSERFLDSPPAFDPSSQALSNLLSLMTNNPAFDVKMLMNGNVDTDAAQIDENKPIISGSGCNTDTSSANSEHAAEIATSGAQNFQAFPTMASASQTKTAILQSQLRTQKMQEQAAENQLKKSELELELVRMQIRKFREENAHLSEDGEPERKRSRHCAPGPDDLNPESP